jgi:hypothetical protein
MWTQAKIYVAAAMLIVWSAVLLYLGFQGGRASGAAREASLLSKQMDAVLSEQAEQAKRAEKLQKTLDRLPKSEGKVREIVRDNPSGCMLPPAVVDGLREAIRSANAARALPSDS